jgi:hypothetical protein
MKSLLVVTRRYLYRVYNYHGSRACGYKRSEILPRIDGYGMVLGMVWFRYGFGIIFVEAV